MVMLNRIWWWYQRQQGAYVQQIQILAPDKPLDLPAVKPLKARKIFTLVVVRDQRAVTR